MTLVKMPGSEDKKKMNWYCDFYDAQGKRHRVSCKTANKKLAAEVEVRLKSEAFNEKMLGRKPARLRTLGRVLEGYVRWAEAQGRSADRARQCAAHVEQILGADTNASSLGAQQVDAYKEIRLKEQAAAGTIKRELVVLIAALNHAVRTGLLNANPLAGKVRQIKTQPRTRLLSDSERERLLEAAARGPRHLLPFLRLLLLTGLRRNEALCLRWADIDFGKRTLIVQHGKGDKSRLIPLSRQAIAVLAGLARHSEWVFDSRGRRIGSVKNSWRTCCRRAGIEDLCLHDLRRAFASALATRGVSPFIIQSLLGHSQLRTTEVYVTLSESARMAGVEVIPDLSVQVKSQKSGQELGRRPFSEDAKAAV